MSSVTELLDGYRPGDDSEAADLDRVRELAATAPDPWARLEPLHVTASALVIHPESGRVLLRWHQRQQAWLQVGGHGDPGEIDPLDIALREAREETGLTDLVPWPDASLRHLVIVNVPASASKGEPAHEHADLRFVFATGTPDAIRPENSHAELRWLTLDEAYETTSEDNLRETLRRAFPKFPRLRPILRAARSEQTHDHRVIAHRLATGANERIVMPKRNVTRSAQASQESQEPQKSRVSRRSVLRGAAGASAAGLAGAALGTAALATPADAASAQQPRPAPAAPGARRGNPIVVHVRDAHAGDIEIFAGTSQTSLRDRDLAARIARAIA